MDYSLCYMDESLNHGSFRGNAVIGGSALKHHQRPLVTIKPKRRALEKNSDFPRRVALFSGGAFFSSLRKQMKKESQKLQLN